MDLQTIFVKPECGPSLLYYDYFMKTKIVLICTLAALLFLSGCATPVVETTPIESPAPQTITTTATQTPTHVSPDPTEPASVNTPFQLVQLDMIDALNGIATLIFPEGKQIFAISNDGWRSWRDITPPNATAIPSTYFFDELNGFALVFPKDAPPFLWKTKDGGNSWFAPTNYPTNNGTEITFLNDQYGLSKEVDGGAGHAYVKFYETADGGDNWSLLPLLSPDPNEGLPEGVIDLCNICQDLIEQTEMDTLVVHGEMANEPTPYIKIEVSNDRGMNWSRIDFPKPEGFGSSAVIPLNAVVSPVKWVVALGTVSFVPEQQYNLIFLESFDNGNTWSFFDPKITLSSMPPTNFKFLNTSSAYIVDSEVLFFIDLDSHQFEAKPINDLFTEADPIKTNTPIVEFVDRENGWFIFNMIGSSNVYSTTNGGTSWTEIVPTQVTHP